MSFYYKNFNLGFVHIPKCAGQSIFDWSIQKPVILGLEKTNDQHDFSEEVLKHVSNYFTIVRNPFGRMASYYEFTKSRIEFWEYNGFSVFDGFPDFKGFLKKVFDKEIYIAENFKAHYKVNTPQVEWIRSGDPIILRYENLYEDFKKIQSITNLSHELPHINFGQRIHYVSYYDSESRKIVENAFEEDFDTFKYTF